MPTAEIPKGKEFPKMRKLVRFSLTMLSLSAIIATRTVDAQSPSPAGYAPNPGVPTMVGADGRAVTVQPVQAIKAAPAQAAAHKHKLRTLCAKCAKKAEMMPTERIVACAHSKNGVCPTCQALLAMPGTVTVGAPASAPGEEAPGRALASSTPAAAGMNQLAASRAPVPAIYDPSATPEPSPIGVMQTNYAQPGMAAPAAPANIPTASSMQPGHALAASAPANPAPFQHKPTSSKNPHIIGHIFGYYGFGSEWREQYMERKTQAHASIPYNNEGTTINELPASMVFGKP